MSTEVLDAAGDATRWDEVLRSLPEDAADVYHRAAYVGLQAEGEARALLFVHRAGAETWAYPFLMRPVRRVGAAVFDPPWHDLEGAYGYGGPVSTTHDPAFLAAAHAAFAGWCREARVVAEFVRLHPLLGNAELLDPAVRVVEDRETVSVALEGFRGGAIPFEASARREVGRAERAGLRARICPAEGPEFEVFRELYARRMEQLGADAFYLFGDAYFRGLRALAAEAGWLSVVETDERIVAAAVFLRGGSRLHYHLSAAEMGAAPGATNLLVCAAARRGLEEGLRVLHLGGGRTPAPDDSLFRFKRRMGTETHSFHIGMRVHDPAAYAGLRAAWEAAHPELVPVYGGRLLCYRYGEAQ